MFNQGKGIIQSLSNTIVKTKEKIPGFERCVTIGRLDTKPEQNDPTTGKPKRASTEYNFAPALVFDKDGNVTGVRKMTVVERGVTDALYEKYREDYAKWQEQVKRPDLPIGFFIVLDNVKPVPFAYAQKLVGVSAAATSEDGSAPAAQEAEETLGW
jgi:hypothetical protein